VSGVRRRLRRCLTGAPRRQARTERASPRVRSPSPGVVSTSRRCVRIVERPRRTFERRRRCPVPPRVTTHRPPVPRRPGFMPRGRAPPEFLASFRRPGHARSRAPGSCSLRFGAPRRRHRIGPRMRRTVRVRHGSAHGVSTPSAASWLDLASDRPPRGSRLTAPIAPSGLRLPSELSLRVGRAPLVEAAGSPVVRPGRSPVRRARSCHPRFHRLGRRSGVGPRRILRELGAPFQRRLAAPPPGHPGPRTPGSPRPGRSVDFEAFFPTASPFASATTVSRRAGGRCSPGRSRPSRALLPP